MHVFSAFMEFLNMKAPQHACFHVFLHLVPTLQHSHKEVVVA